MKHRAIEDNEFITRTGLPIRRSNPPEDITENIVKTILCMHTSDTGVVWCKGIGKDLSGDCWSSHNKFLEVKAFTSVGPSSFGPKKKFNKIYFLDLQRWLEDQLTLWEVNLSNESLEWKGIKMNKEETHETQADDGRRPHISWAKIKEDLEEKAPGKVSKIYEGTFEGIFMRNSSGA